MTTPTASAIADAAGQLFGGNVIRSAEDAESVWSTLTERGFSLVGIEEELGGSGGDLADAAALATMVGSHAVPIPFLEHNQASWLLAELGFKLPDRLAALGRAIPSDREDQWSAVVPWGRSAQTFVVESRDPYGSQVSVAVVSRDDVAIEEQLDLASQPSDVVTARRPQEPIVLDARLCSRWTARLAYLRAHALLGAAERVAAMTAEYAVIRQQFGVPIARFQAIQGSLANIGGHVRLLRAACDALLPSDACADTVRISVLSARVLAGEVATLVSRLAHQIHGAIGYTSEYDLQQFTRRLMLWREADAPQAHWTRSLGKAVILARSDAMWRELVDTPDAKVAAP